MDLREKLIELLDEVHHKQMGKTYRERIETIADHLIANGVTVQEWIPVTERLPDTFEIVLLAMDYVAFPCKEKHIVIGSMYKDAVNRPRYLEHFKTLYEPTTNLIEDRFYKVTRWMPLPELPKEEQ